MAVAEQDGVAVVGLPAGSKDTGIGYAGQPAPPSARCSARGAWGYKIGRPNNVDLTIVQQPVEVQEDLSGRKCA